MVEQTTSPSGHSSTDDCSEREAPGSEPMRSPNCRPCMKKACWSWWFHDISWNIMEYHGIYGIYDMGYMEYHGISWDIWVWDIWIGSKNGLQMPTFAACLMFFCLRLRTTLRYHHIPRPLPPSSGSIEKSIHRFVWRLGSPKLHGISPHGHHDHAWPNQLPDLYI